VIASRRIALVAEPLMRSFALPRIAPSRLLDNFYPLDLIGAGQPEVHTVALPLLGGMTGVTVHTAHLSLEAVRHEVERPVDPTILGDAAPPNGVLIQLSDDSRLIGFDLGPVTPRTLPVGQHLLIRAATKDGDAWTYGPPLFSLQPSASPPLPGGMTMHATEPRVRFPALAGRAWLIELLDELPNAVPRAKLAVTTIVLEELPHDLTVTADEEGETLVLWNHAGVLTPEQGPQDVDFRSMAERLMTNGQRTLSLNVTSRTPAKVAIIQPRVEATWEAQPHEEPLRVALRGAWERLPLQPPPQLRPGAATLRVTARHLGRELNSATTARTTSNAGLRVDRNSSVAALAAFHPQPGTLPLRLAAVRLALMVFDAAEVVIELRANAAGRPGEPLAPKAVRKLEARTDTWLEIEWAEPPLIAPALSAFWIVLRATGGMALWCGDPPPDSRQASSRETSRVLVSSDGGTSWTPPDTLLAAPQTPGLEVFHAAVVPQSVSIDLRAAGTPVVSWTLPRIKPESREFSTRVALPPEMLQRFPLAPELMLRSTSALDVNVDEIVLSYDPGLA
jgi:hypothetical protein